MNTGSTKESLAYVCSLWTLALFATIAAGGLFGLVERGFLGLLIGPIFAGFFGVPVVLSVATLTWAFWLWRFSNITAAIGGGATGFISTAFTWDTVFNTDFETAVTIAAFIGAILPGLAVTYFQRLRQRHVRQKRVNAEDNSSDNVWQLSLQDLFLRFTVVAALIAAWSIGVLTLLDGKRVRSVEVNTIRSNF